MKILLIYPYFLNDRIASDDFSVVPMGVYYVAAMLREHRFDVEVLNWSSLRTAPDEIEAQLADKRPDMVGLSLVHANRWGGIDIARQIKRLFPQVPVVAGGIGATFLWRHLLEHFKEIDYIVRGEGEIPFLQLARHLSGDSPTDPKAIKGLAFRRHGRPFRTPPSDPIRDLDGLPDPARYFQFQHVALTRGCPGKCSFCGSPRFWRPPVRSHSADYFVDQLTRLQRRGIRFFYVSDDTFTFRKSRVIDICKKIIRTGLKISWAAISRVNYVDSEILYWMRLAGCIQISYGVESGSEAIRHYLNKRIDSGQIERAFAWTVRYGILARAYFIYGNRGESEQTLRETLALMDRIKPLGAIFYILTLYPGTDLCTAFQRQTGSGDDIWLERIEDIPYFETDPHLSAETVFAFGRRLRAHFHRRLPDYVEAIELADSADLAASHADFLSRLAMTFDQGDFAGIDEIPRKPQTAELLYRRSLQYHPDPKAYLGLAILRQKARDYPASIELLSQGISQFPNHKELNICMGVSCLNMGRPREALDHLLKFKDAEEAQPLLAACRSALGMQ